MDSENKKPQPKPPEKRKDCPACKAVHPQEVTQCMQCGVIFSKWKTPQQRAAEKRLESLGQEVDHFSWPAKIFIFLLIAVPIATFVLPDINYRLFGVRLKYKVKEGQQFQKQGLIEYAVVTNNDKTTPSQLMGEWNLRILESDSGGNALYREWFNDVTMFTPTTPIGERRGSQFLFETNFKMNPYGKKIVTLMDTTTQIQRNAKTRQRHAQQWQEIQREKSMELLGDPETAKPFDQEAPSTERSLVAFMVNHDLNILDISTQFEYPKNKLRPSDTWSQPVKWWIYTPDLRIRLEETLPFKVLGYKRDGLVFCTRVGWNWNVNPEIEGTRRKLGSDIKESGRGNYKGEACIDSRNGFVHDLEGEFDIGISPSSAYFPDVLNALFEIGVAGHFFSVKTISLRGRHVTKSL